MRVFLANYTLSMMRGGGETRDLAIARELERLGVVVEMLTVQPILGQVRYPVQEVPCRYLAAPYFRDLVYRLMQLPKGGRLAAMLLRQDVVQFSRKVVELLSNPAEQVDVLQGSGLYPIVKLKRHRPLAVVVRNQGGLPPSYLRPFVTQADAVIGDGWDAENFSRCLGRKLVEIPGGVDLDRFRPASSETAAEARRVREQLGLEGAEVVLYVGRFAPLKNVSLLIDAFALLRQSRSRARLVLVGEGALGGSLRSRVRRLGLTEDVHFAGARPSSELAVFYSMANVFALPSSFDNSPNVLLEAMACGLPVVATRVGGVPRYVANGENGLLVEPGNPAALAAALHRTIEDADLRALLVRAGFEYVRARDWSRSARKLLSLYECLLAKRRSGVSSGSARF